MGEKGMLKGYWGSPGRPMSNSEAEKLMPGWIRRVTGFMDICEDCGSRYRRTKEAGRAICGRCYPSPLETDSKLAG